MALSDESRKALVQYLELVKGGVGIDKRVTTRFGKSTAPMHPMLSEALSSLSDRFAELILDDQDCFKTREGWEKLLKLLPADEEGESIHVMSQPFLLAFMIFACMARAYKRPPR
jgi:DNA primase small subunit